MTPWSTKVIATWHMRASDLGFRVAAAGTGSGKLLYSFVKGSQKACSGLHSSCFVLMVLRASQHQQAVTCPGST